MLEGVLAKVSIITVARNCEQVVGGAIESVRRQRYPNIDYVFVDGGSDDGTNEIVRRNLDRISIHVSEPDGGIYFAMNKGLKLASGEIVGFLNADDFFVDGDCIADIAAAFRGDSGERPADVVYGDIEYVDSSQPAKRVRLWRAGRFASTSLKWGWMPPHPSFYVRRDLISRLGGFDTRFRIAADYDLMLRCLTTPGVRVQYVPRVLVRMRAGGVSNGTLRMIIRKTCEDVQVLRKLGMGGIWTVIWKNLRKVGQFFQ